MAHSGWGGRRGEAWGRAVEEGEGCDVLINKRQLCMMLTAGWSGPRHNPPRLLLTFQRPGAYPRRRAQSSLSRSSSVQGSGGGRPWLSLSYQPSEKHTHTHTFTLRARTPCRYCMCRPSEIPPGKMPSPFPTPVCSNVAFLKLLPFVSMNSGALQALQCRRTVSCC